MVGYYANREKPHLKRGHPIACPPFIYTFLISLYISKFPFLPVKKQTNKESAKIHGHMRHFLLRNSPCLDLGFVVRLVHNLLIIEGLVVGKKKEG